jgi:GMP synthase (glutamine-hydrolysing)
VGPPDEHRHGPGAYHSKLFAELPVEQVVWMSHGDLVVEAPAGFTIDATSASCPISSMSDKERNLYAVQFHPEVRHSVHGTEILKNFVLSVCDCKGDWSMENFIEIEMEKILLWCSCIWMDGINKTLAEI